MQQTDFDNDEAVGYLADRLAKLGVEAELAKLGAKPAPRSPSAPADGVTFDWEPTLGEAAAVEALAGPRGTDKRLADSLRLTRAERNARRRAARAVEESRPRRRPLPTRPRTMPSSCWGTGSRREPPALRTRAASSSRSARRR